MQLLYSENTETKKEANHRFLKDCDASVKQTLENNLYLETAILIA